MAYPTMAGTSEHCHQKCRRPQRLAMRRMSRQSLSYATDFASSHVCFSKTVWRHLASNNERTRASDTQQGLVDIIHREVPLGHGVIVTMPSQWNSAVTNAGSSWNPRTYSGPSHVGLACGVGQDGAQGYIRVMNPWGGFWQDESDSWWAAQLLAGEVWVATMTIPSGWRDDGRTLTAPNGVPVVRGFRDWILAHGWDAGNVPMKVSTGHQQWEH